MSDLSKEQFWETLASPTRKGCWNCAYKTETKDSYYCNRFITKDYACSITGPFTFWKWDRKDY